MCSTWRRTAYAWSSLKPSAWKARNIRAAATPRKISRPMANSAFGRIAGYRTAGYKNLTIPSVLKNTRPKEQVFLTDTHTHRFPHQPHSAGKFFKLGQLHAPYVRQDPLGKRGVRPAAAGRV